jgi:ABC-type branched-subunit amino acid transport system ATPase component
MNAEEKGDPSMPIQNLRIENFRGFRLFRMANPRRINLIVGANNSGKTTVLEAINVLMSGGDSSVIWSILYRRGETVWVGRAEERRGGSTQFEIKRLFHNNEIDNLAFLRISADTDRGEVAATARIEPSRPATERDPQGAAFPRDEFAEEVPRPCMLKLAWSPGPMREAVFPIDRRGSVSTSTIVRTARGSGRHGCPLRFLGAPPSSPECLTALFEEIAEAPEHERVTDWVRIIDPTIERVSSGRLAGVRSVPVYGSGTGIVVRRKGDDEWIPIETLGMGARRLFALAVNMVHASNGILLVDEIDAGIHHSVMEDLWKIVDSASKTYNVQVFATTHSRDGYQSLASICCEGDSDDGGVTIQRIEQGREKAVAYSEPLIVAAAKHDIEVR